MIWYNSIRKKYNTEKYYIVNNTFKKNIKRIYFEVKVSCNLNLVVIYLATKNLEVSEPKWVNPVLNIIGVNTLRLGGLHL